jgi:glycosyltransferase involved in cell wall biosynthesis
MTALSLPTQNIALGGPVIIDIGAIQGTSARGRGIGKYILNFCLALEKEAPELVANYLLDPDLPPPGNLAGLVESGKVIYTPKKLRFAPEARVFCCMWPLDQDRSLKKIMPPAVKQSNLTAAVLVYDMIMALEKEYAPQNPTDKARFASRLEVIRSADLIFTISEKTKADVVNYFDIQTHKVINIGAAADRQFVPVTSKDVFEEKMHLLTAKIPGLRSKYILCPTGSHPRKNNERLIQAFLSIDKKIRLDTQLVFSGDLPESMANHFKYMASFSKDVSDILTTGQLPQDLFLALYQCASFAVFPSLSEGFGLPIAEALACGKEVLASDIAPFDELLNKEMLFNPLSIEDIRARLARELQIRAETDIYEIGQRELPHRTTSWEEVGRKAVGSIHTALSSPRRRIEKKKKRLGIMSPLPPAASGVAAYTYRLIEELIGLGYFSITAFADGPFPGGNRNRIPAYTPDDTAYYRSYSLPVTEGLLGGFDQVLYCFGNSHHHLGALSCLPKRPGVVLAHDVRLTNLYRHYHGRPGTAQTGLSKDIEKIYGIALEESLCKDNELSPYAIDTYSLLLARRVITLSDLYLVHSYSAKNLALMDALPQSEDKISVIPFAVEKNTGFDENSSPESESDISLWLRKVRTRHLIAHFGIVDPIKNPKLILEAYRQLHLTRDDTVLAFVGPIDKSLAKELTTLADNLGISDEVKFTGKVSDADFNRILEQSCLALQPRSDFNGEASAAVANTLASGIPTIATDTGWMRDLPDDAVVKMPAGISASELSKLLLELLQDTKRRKTLSDSAIAYAAKYSFSYVAQVLSEILLTTC